MHGIYNIAKEFSLFDRECIIPNLGNLQFIKQLTSIGSFILHKSNKYIIEIQQHSSPATKLNFHGKRYAIVFTIMGSVKTSGDKSFLFVTERIFRNNFDKERFIETSKGTITLTLYTDKI